MPLYSAREVIIGQQSDRDIIDESVLEQIRRLGGNELVRKLVELFFSYAEPMVDKILFSCRAGNREELERTAHALKSSAGKLGARELESLANEIERLAAEKEVLAVRPLLAGLEKALLRAREHLTEEGRGLKP